ncbi:MAG: FAD-binding oxidoreductase [Streptosporangiaceae bacterium]
MRSGPVGGGPEEVLVISDPAAEPTGAGAELAAALRRVVGGEIRFDSYSRHLFSRDASMYAIEPIGVVFPRDADDVAATTVTAAEFGVPVLPRGAGTSLAGQTVGRAVVMDVSRHMGGIIEIDAERRMARVQPGVVQEQLNLAAARYGLVFGPDTSTSNRATLGGMIGNNSAGSQSVRYGMTIDHVLALDVVLSDGEPVGVRPADGGGAAQPRRRGNARRGDLPGAARPAGTPPGGHCHRLPAVLAASRWLPAGPAGRIGRGRRARSGEAPGRLRGHSGHRRGGDGPARARAAVPRHRHGPLHLRAGGD